MPQGLFFACRVLATKPDRLEYVVFQVSEISSRNYVEVASRDFATVAEAELEIENVGGVIPTGMSKFLDYFDVDGETVWCWKDDRTLGSSQIFKSEQAALAAWDAEELVFDTVLD